jgi:very-short-patch-repair endonuclease
VRIDVCVCQNRSVVGDMDLVVLRELLGVVISSISGSSTHKTLGGACEILGLPTPPDEGTKHERVFKSFADLPDTNLPRVAEKILIHQPLDAKTRNEIQDVLWADEDPQIPKRTRREIARDLDLADVVHSADRFRALLDRLWVLDDDLLGSFLDGGASLGARIDRHVFRNPGDWSTEELFENLGAFEAPDKRFALFLEGLASADVVLDEPAQRSIANALNPHLRAIGIELRGTGADGGYPVFSVTSTGLRNNSRPKNLIFASLAKPDIRFRDAINNDIEIVENADSVLVYDRPIGADGIRWHDLQTWWRETRGLQSDDEAKSTLYQRLRKSLPANSPPQLLLYDLYHKIFSTSVQDLPALLPEVWLHWDPKTVKVRGVDALLRFRMDFLLLLPHGQRVVLEVDGTQHYANNGQPDPAAYASNMRADRDLKLSGYEVFRFGAAELQDRQQAREMIQRFFEDLFRGFDVNTA